MTTIEQLQEEIARLREEKAQDAEERRIKKLEMDEKKNAETLAFQQKMKRLSVKENSLENLVLCSTMGNK